MRVVRATRFGGPEVLEPGEAPDPEPGRGEIVVDLAVAEVLFLDTQLRAGWGRGYFELETPFVPGGRIGAEAVELTGRGSRFFSYGSASGEFAGIEAEAE